MKIDLTIHLDKKTIRTVMEEWMRSVMIQTEKRSRASKKGWETRRKKLHPELIKKAK